MNDIQELAQQAFEVAKRSVRLLKDDVDRFLSKQIPKGPYDKDNEAWMGFPWSSEDGWNVFRRSKLTRLFG